ncbi:hypothetical protein BpHYR1_032686 [Brachionus plicatilis]|uniref:Uncharacterized protein n=1 Tax=Brachionus plicatilis TaxID=10195 RepID=A0A3M7R727_BRAPC|nr:hypothetical protein BpHYR1_032686 [Brachionus plicatilis]
MSYLTLKSCSDLQTKFAETFFCIKDYNKAKFFIFSHYKHKISHTKLFLVKNLQIFYGLMLLIITDVLKKLRLGILRLCIVLLFKHKNKIKQK